MQTNQSETMFNTRPGFLTKIEAKQKATGEYQIAAKIESNDDQLIVEKLVQTLVDLEEQLEAKGKTVVKAFIKKDS